MSEEVFESKEAAAAVSGGATGTTLLLGDQNYNGQCVVFITNMKKLLMVVLAGLY